MTVIVFASAKGAPGVTTVASLVAATWPEDRKVILAECDPSGGDLAARFGLSSKCGWSSFATASRRAGPAAELGRHLQQLPGGLDVLIGGRSQDGSELVTTTALLSRAASDPGGPRDLFVDLGRLLPGGLGAEGWLDHSDAVAIVLRSDAASVLQVRERARTLLSRCEDRVGLVVVRTGEYPGSDIERFTGIPLIGEMPFDPAGAAVATGGQGSRRRLSRSLLVMSAFRLGETLRKGDSAPQWAESQTGTAPQEELAPVSSSTPERIRAPRRIWTTVTQRSIASSPFDPQAEVSRKEVLQ